MNCQKSEIATKKDLNGCNILGYNIFRTINTYTRTLIILILMLVILIPFLYSCSNKMIIAEQDRNLSSAYTHSGKYANYNGIGKKRDGIRKNNLKCHIPSKRK
jgi:hypothetical protein